MSRKYTTEEIRNKVREISSSELLSTEYTGTFDRMRFRCACGNEFETDWHHFYTQHQRTCLECAAMRRHTARRLTDEAVSAILKEHGCYLVGPYKTGREKMTILCSCGHLRDVSLNSIRSKQANFSGLCAECSLDKFGGSNKLSIGEVAARCADFGVPLASPVYVDARSPIAVMCKCGRVYQAYLSSIKSGQTKCPYCSGHVSDGEKAVEDWLIRNGIDYVREKKFQDLVGNKNKVMPYRFDFYLPALNACIEFDGIQHFKNIAKAASPVRREELAMEFIEARQRDVRKTEYCKSHGIDLIRISYKEVDRIEEILKSTLIPRKAAAQRP